MEPNIRHNKTTSETSFPESMAHPPGLSDTTPESRDSLHIINAVADYLRKRPNNVETLSKVALFLRARRLTPDVPLKRLIETCPKFQMIEVARHFWVVRLASSHTRKERTPSDYIRQDRADCTAEPEGEFHQEVVEAFLIDYIKRKGGQCGMQMLGSACLDELGISMKGRMKAFMDERPHIFAPCENGRQIYCLLADTHTTPPYSSFREDPNNTTTQTPTLEAIAVGGYGLPALPDDLLPTPSSQKTTSSYNTNNNEHTGIIAPPAPSYVFAKWDKVTQAIYLFVRGQGAATLPSIDAHLRKHHIQDILACFGDNRKGLKPETFKAQIFLAKRKNLFKVQGPLVTLRERTWEEYGSSRSHFGSNQRQNSADQYHYQQSRWNDESYSVDEGQDEEEEEEEEFNTQGGEVELDVGGDDKLEMDIDYIKQQLFEQLKDQIAPLIKQSEDASQSLQDGLSKLGIDAREVESKIATAIDSVMARVMLSIDEIHRESASLRAAAMTTARELIALKDEFANFKMQISQNMSGHHLHHHPGMLGPGSEIATPQPGPYHQGPLNGDMDIGPMGGFGVKRTGGPTSPVTNSWLDGPPTSLHTLGSTQQQDAPYPKGIADW